MKKNLLRIRLLPAISVLFIHQHALSQANITSTTGYTVHVIINPLAILPSTGSCPFGYNYNVRLAYNVNITGSNIPPALYTLQGSLACTGSSNFFSLPLAGGIGTANTSSNPWSSVPDCSTATIASKNCNTVNLRISGPGISLRTVSFSVPTVVLPISLVNFAAIVQGSRVRIQWSTASEINTDYFTSEKSIDGINWQEVKKVKSAGNTSTILNYECLDETPLQGTSYYRLKQTDLDGNFSFSGTRAVRYIKSGSISIYPVPNTGNTISIEGITEYNQYDLSVMNTSGKALYSTPLSSTSIELPQLPTGVYLIRLNNRHTGKMEIFRYVKL